MRVRTILLVMAILLIAGFVALNLDEFTRSSALNLGFTTIELPLGLLMLLLLAGATTVFLASTLYMQSRNLLESRTHSRELNAQRELADKAEASRFTELRSFLQAQAEEEQRRESAMSAELAERLAQQQQALLARIEQLDNGLSACIGEFEDRLEGGAKSPALHMRHHDGSVPRI